MAAPTKKHPQASKAKRDASKKANRCARNATARKEDGC